MIGALRYLKRFFVDVPLDLFAWMRFFWFRARSTDDSITDLNKTGLQVLDGVLTCEEVKLLEKVAKSYALESKLSLEGQARGRVYAQGLIDERLGGIVKKFSVVAKRYLNSEVIKLELTYFQLSNPVSCSSDVPGGEYHLDDNKPNIKFFVYLSDVSEVNGPFRVVPGTHGISFRKLSRYLKWSFFKNRSNLYSDNDHLDRLDAASVNLVGPKGFCFVADTTAWHRAETVKLGQRQVFVASFNLA